jgi:hypothetical protein
MGRRFVLTSHQPGRGRDRPELRSHVLRPGQAPDLESRSGAASSTPPGAERPRRRRAAGPGGFDVVIAECGPTAPVSHRPCRLLNIDHHLGNQLYGPSLGRHHGAGSRKMVRRPPRLKAAIADTALPTSPR